MTRFIKLFDGSYCNVDVIGSLVPKKTDEGEYYYEVYSRERRSLGRVGWEFNPHNSGAVVIKAEPGFFLVSPRFSNDELVEITQYPIIAWSIMDGASGEVAPICFAPEIGGGHCGANVEILFPNGEVRGGDNKWKNLHEYGESLKAELREMMKEKIVKAAE